MSEGWVRGENCNNSAENGNSPGLFQKLLPVPCPQMTPKTEHGQEGTEMGKARVKKRGMANRTKCSQEVQKAKGWKWRVDWAVWKLLVTVKEAVHYRRERS